MTPAIKIRLEAEMSWHLRWGNIRFLTAGILNSEFRRFRREAAVGIDPPSPQAAKLKNSN